MNKILRVLGVFSGRSETENGKNEILFYFCGFRGAAFILFCGGGGRAHWCRLCRLFGASGPAGGWLWSFRGVFPSFCPLSRSSLGVLSTNMALFRVLRAFLARFGVFVWVCLVLVLCVACVAFVRVNS